MIKENHPHNPCDIVGKFYEDFAMRLFDLEKVKTKSLPDLVSKGEIKFYVEVKGSYKDNGSVIKGEQLERYNESIYERLFYALFYHLIKTGTMQKDYKTENKLITGLEKNFSSVFLIPRSIIIAHYENSTVNAGQHAGPFVLMKERTAKEIFAKIPEFWGGHLNLKPDSYCFNELFKDKVYLITKKIDGSREDGFLEREIANSFNPQALA